MSKARKKRSGLPPSPSYRFSGRYIWVSFWLAWGVILALSAGALWGSELAVKMADIVVPSMVAMIVVLLGVHRGFGSLDFRSSQKHGAQAEEEAAGGYESAYGGRQRNE